MIDRSRGAIYVVAMSKMGSTYFQRLHALDITTGTELFGGPRNIQASFPGTGAGSSGGSVPFSPKQYEERAALLLAQRPARDELDVALRHRSLYRLGDDLRSVHARPDQRVERDAERIARRVLDGRRRTGPPMQAATCTSSMATARSTRRSTAAASRASATSATLSSSSRRRAGLRSRIISPRSTPSRSRTQTAISGSGGVLLLPDLIDNGSQVRHLAVGAGKDRHIYVVNRDSMGKWNASSNQIYQDISGALNGSVFSKPVYFNNTAVCTPLRVMRSRHSPSPTHASRRRPRRPARGRSPIPDPHRPFRLPDRAMASSGRSKTRTHAVLHAYDAGNLSHELYNSNQAASSRDAFGAGNKFITPMVVNGRVHVGTRHWRGGIRAPQSRQAAVGSYQRQGRSLARSA